MTFENQFDQSYHFPVELSDIDTTKYLSREIIPNGSTEAVFSIAVPKAYQILDFDSVKQLIGPAEIPLLAISSEDGLSVYVVNEDLIREIDPADWLEEYLKKQNRRLRDKRISRTSVGNLSDTLTTSVHDNIGYVHRDNVAKIGSKVFRIGVFCKESDYIRLANEMLFVLASFQLQIEGGITAESIRIVAREEPFNYSFATFESWSEVASTKQTKQSALLFANEFLGKSKVFMTFGVSKKNGQTPESCLSESQRLISKIGFEIGGPMKPSVFLFGDTMETMTQDLIFGEQTAVAHHQVYDFGDHFVAISFVAPNCDEDSMWWMVGKQAAHFARQTTKIGIKIPNS